MISAKKEISTQKKAFSPSSCPEKKSGTKKNHNKVLSGVFFRSLSLFFLLGHFFHQQMWKRALCCSVTCSDCFFFVRQNVQLIIDRAQKQSMTFVSTAMVASSAGKFLLRLFRSFSQRRWFECSIVQDLLNWLVNFDCPNMSSRQSTRSDSKHKSDVLSLPLATSNHRAHALRLSGFSTKATKTHPSEYSNLSVANCTQSAADFQTTNIKNDITVASLVRRKSDLKYIIIYIQTTKYKKNKYRVD